VNYEIPNIPETYVHRIGRTGRAGHNGKAISFCDVEERAYLKDIQKLIDIQLPVNDDHPFPAKNLKPEGKAKAKPQQRGGRPSNSNKRPQGNKNGNDRAPKSERTAKKKWSWKD